MCTLLFIYMHEELPSYLVAGYFLIALEKYIVEGLWVLFKVDLSLSHSCCLQNTDILIADLIIILTFTQFSFLKLNITVEDSEGTF